MAIKAKKAKRDNRVVIYVRARPEDQAEIAQIAAKRGYPHTLSSVTSEMLMRGLEAARRAEIP